MSDQVIVKFWVGWLQQSTFDPTEAAAQWAEAVGKFTAEGYESHVFKIKKDDYDTIADIETLLQSRYNSEP